jgi:hypothetical protein
VLEEISKSSSGAKSFLGGADIFFLATNISPLLSISIKIYV